MTQDAPTPGLRACPVPWCSRDDAPHTWQDCADEWCVICPSCGVNGPTRPTEGAAKEAWADLPACNAYPELVAALEGLLERYVLAIGNEGPEALAARAALAKAKAGVL